MLRRGIATFTLDYGRCPKWLFERMVKLGREMVRLVVEEEGPEEFLRRLAEPAWFQALGTVLAFDWNSSGLTTILTAALKEAVRGEEQNLGIFICGGKGKTSKKTPGQISHWGEKLALAPSAVEGLVYNSKMAAKVDSALVQDGFQIYHHSFFFTRSGAWTVVQQGMNTENQTARRYHWHSAEITDLICEPHSAITSEIKLPRVLNLTAQDSGEARQLSTELVSQSLRPLFKDLILLDKYSTPYSKTAHLQVAEGQLTLLNLADTEFKYHSVVRENFSASVYLKKILERLCYEKPPTYEKLLATVGVGPKTVRALALVAEIIYGAKLSYRDPARYSFAHGGKDATPYPVDRKTYDRTIETLKKCAKRLRF